MSVLTSPTIEDLITNVRDMLNQQDASNSYWSDEEITGYLNEGARRYYAEIVNLFDGQFTTTTSLDIVSGAELVALPTDFFSAKGVYRTVSNGYQLMPYRNNITQGYNTSGAGGNAYIPSYYFRGNNLVLRPVPNFSETGGIFIEYTQFPDEMINGGDTLTAQISPVFKDLIQMYAVWKAKVKESLGTGVDTTAIAKSNLNDLYMAFKECIQLRSAAPTSTIPFNPEIE